MRAQVYTYSGVWVARCPRPDCPGAEHFGPYPGNGYVGGLTRNAFRCAHCTLVCAADWPPEWSDIERTLAQRPVPATRNWQPGETLTDLLIENITHGITPSESEMGCLSSLG